jgi:hypothetical protein
MCFPALLAITSIQRAISEFVVRFQIPNLKWEQPFDIASMYGKQKAFWCAMIRWSLYRSPGCAGNPLLGVA